MKLSVDLLFEPSLNTEGAPDTSDNQRIHLFIDTQVDDRHRSLPRGVTDQLGEVAVA
jgi:hypothetical protein